MHSPSSGRRDGKGSVRRKGRWMSPFASISTGKRDVGIPSAYSFVPREVNGYGRTKPDSQFQMATRTEPIPRKMAIKTLAIA